MADTIYREPRYLKSASGLRFHPDSVISVLYLDVLSVFGSENEGFGGCPEQGNRESLPACVPMFWNPRTGLPLLSSTQVHRTLTRRFLKSRSESFSAVASQIHRLTYARNRTKVSDIGRSILSASSARSSASTYVRYTVSSVICLRGSLIPDSGSIVSHRCLVAASHIGTSCQK